MKRLLGRLVFLMAVVIFSGLGYMVVAATETTITIDTNKVVGTIDRRILGVNTLWPQDNCGTWDTTNNVPFKSFDKAAKELAFTGFRYPGGTAANLFHWMGAVGPQDQRLNQVSGAPSSPKPFDSRFGPDEYGKMLEYYGCTGATIVVNIGDGTAQEAADWVAYMTAVSGKWAELRAKNGHAKPYQIPFWEVGNEIGFQGQSYWMSGARYDEAAAVSDVNLTTYRYINGGYSKFTGQIVGKSDDHRPAAALSDGRAKQTFQVYYPPVKPGTATVYVAGEAWAKVAKLAGSTSSDKVYTLDEKTGKLCFGDGINGKIPDQNAQVTIDYVSGPHEGFKDFYAKLKAVNPKIKVCIGWDSEPSDYIIQNTPKFDGVVYHPYKKVTKSVPLSEYHPALMLTALNDVPNDLASLQKKLDRYQPGAVIICTEYGHNGNSPSDAAKYETGSKYQLTLSEGLFDANMLKAFAEAGIPYAGRHRLADWVFEERPAGAADVGLRWPAVIAGPEPFVAEPQAKVLALFSRIMGTQRLDSGISGNPTEAGAWGTLGTLQILATRIDAATVGIIVINESAANDVAATVQFNGMKHQPIATVFTVNGDGIMSTNTRENPNAVDLTSKDYNTGGTGNFNYIFPAHSVTGFKLTNLAGTTNP